ncbi:glycosyltransferase family 4 protein [Cellulophaga sp. HaHa_2_95]|uniref:glycosyltransferase family 4 protein n=1 Tax=Cellulophaga sp. HaHa_2_95 TaxID=2745558 RepID=UPI001C4F86F3|nr:glycosyltransferase family 4 protein [Cellulophaga sp. HaHa_2_95]QXP55247.1 glycosyltransferase family 4 protein [Cellulophaga sp. HaHa_2_95]
MKILYIHQYFVIPSEPGGTRSYWISRELIKNGHQVTMITSTRDKNQKGRVNIDGINVIYLYVPYSNKMSILKRLVAFLKFMFLSSWYVIKLEKHDLAIATSTPLTIGFPALVGKLFRGLPYIFEVRDLWPEVPVQMGGVKNKFLIKILYWFERTIYNKSSHVIALSPGMHDGIIKAGTPEKKVTTIPNMSKIDEFWPREKDTKLLDELGLEKDSFKVIYFGTMGLANAVPYIVEGIRHLKSSKDIEFLFLGGGALENKIKEICENEDLSAVHFYGKVPMARLSAIVNLCDVSLVTFSNIPILATNSPNKLFDTLSAGKAIIVNSPGWTKTMVEDNNCGIFVNPKNSKDLANKINYLKDNIKICDEMGRNARILAETTFDKSILCDKFVRTVEKIEI